MSRPLRVLAVTASALLGVVGGVVTGIVAADQSDFYDPLSLGVPMVNQACARGQALLVVDSSNTAAGLTDTVADQEDSRYLETARSCQTAWRHEDQPGQRYVLYLGPFDVDPACEQRLSEEHWDDRVVSLERGTTDTVQCVCHVSYKQMPTLMPGMDRTSLDIVYIKSLQGMLSKLGRRPDTDPTGDYDQETENEVRRLQADAGIDTTGSMGSDTWRVLRNRACDLY